MISKCVFWLTTILAVAHSVKLPPELQDYVNDLHNICIKKSGITESDHASYDPKTNLHDPKIQCYMKCLMLESKWMSPDGEIQYDFIIESAHPEVKDLLVAAINQCRDIPNDDNLCRKASSLNACMFKADPVNWFLV